MLYRENGVFLYVDSAAAVREAISGRHIVLATDGLALRRRRRDYRGRHGQFLQDPGNRRLCRVDRPRTRQPRRSGLVVQRVVDHMRGEGIDAEGMVLEGRPDEMIVAVAKECDADLIVTGSHGRTGLERILFGSTLERTLNDTSCAVLVVKA